MNQHVLNPLWYERNGKVISIIDAKEKQRTLRSQKGAQGGDEASVMQQMMQQMMGAAADGGRAPTAQEFPFRNPPIECVLSDLKRKHFVSKTQQIREYLSKPRIFDSDIIVLPNMFFTNSISTERFQGFTNRELIASDPEFEFIRMVNREAIVNKIIKKVNTTGRCMLYGPQGCGKSFVIIQTVAKLIAKGGVVVFINKSGNLLNDIFAILKAQIKSITNKYDEVINNHENEMLKTTDNVKLESITIKLIQLAKKTFEDYEIKGFYMVLDQLDRAREHVDFLKNLTDYCSCIFASLANNNASKFESEMEKGGIDENLVRFNDLQFWALCILLEQNDLSPIERYQIMSITGGVALQLYTFLGQIKDVNMTSIMTNKLVLVLE